MGMLQREVREVEPTRNEGAHSALCRDDLQGWEDLPPELVWPPHSLWGGWISTKGAADRPQAGMVTGRQVPGLNGTLGRHWGVCKNLGGHPQGEKGGSGC